MQLIRNNLIDPIAFCDYVDGVKAFNFVFVCVHAFEMKFDSWIKCITGKFTTNAGYRCEKSRVANSFIHKLKVLILIFVTIKTN